MFRLKGKAKLINLVLQGILLAAAHPSTRAQDNISASQLNASATILDSTKEQDGLIGPVRRVRTETVKLLSKSGKVMEGAHALLETTTYDLKGKRVENAYYLTASNDPDSAASGGKEEYKYDNKGNITERILRASDNSILSKEIYTYEFDAVGNWTKMLASLAVFEADKLTYEPIEATYRTITYYFNDAIAKLTESVASSTTPPASDPQSSTLTASSTSMNPVVASQSARAASQADSNGASRSPSSAANSVSSMPLNESAGKRETLNSTKAAIKDKTSDTGNTSADGTTTKLGDKSEPAAATSNAVSKPPPNTAKLIPGAALGNRILRLPKPEYPEIAKRLRASGKVSVEVSIDGEGKVISARAVSGAPMFEMSAVRAARQARFAPKAGDKGTTTGTITYVFSVAP
jgi:TonB family protein